MNEQIDIWLVGNTGLRNPNRIQDGFKVFAGSPYVGNLHGKENEIGFMNYLNEKGIIQNEDGKDESGSHARKWRLMFAKNGFIYPQVKKKDEIQEDLGLLDDITPFGRSFLKADTYPAVQECYLRAMSVEQFALPDGIHYFSPLRWLLAIMLELEKRTGTSELSRIEFALWGHTTNPSYNLSEVVDSIEVRKAGVWYVYCGQNRYQYCRNIPSRHLVCKGRYEATFGYCSFDAGAVPEILCRNV